MRENAPSTSVHPSALPLAGWPRADLTCPAPFAPAPLQGSHRYYGPVRPCASRYSASCGVCRLRVSLLRPGGNLHPFRLAVGSEATGSPIPCQRLRRAHATYTPGTARAAGREAPWLRDTPWARLCPGEEPKISGFDAIFWTFDASAVVRSCSSSRRSPYPLVAGLLPQRSLRRLLTAAACGGLGSPPARRARRANLHH
jgi:hypothetical protein